LNLIYKYWKISITGTKINTNTQHQLQANCPTQISDVNQDNASCTPKKQFQLTRKNLINARMESDKLRERYHDTHQQYLIDNGNLTDQQAFCQRRNRERRRICANLFKTIRKGNSTGGLTHILIPSQVDNKQYTSIQQTSKLEETLLHCNIQHFRQAHGTPFTTSAMINTIGHNGVTSISEEILNGKIPDHLPKSPKLLLKQLARVRETIPLDMNEDDMCQGFLKWRKNTTTSPSGKHLGIYKSLIKARKYNIGTKKELKKNATYFANNLLTASMCIQIQFLLMKLSVTTVHT
jgi:hypothetical protein